LTPPTLIVGLTAEARIARRTGWPVFVGGGSAAGAERAARAAVASGAKSLVSFGLAGGLAPDVTPGTVIVAERILTEDGEFTTDDRVSADWGLTRTGTILGHDRVVARASEKAALWRARGARAVDLESGAVARVAAANGLACATLRVVCDPASHDLPSAALLALDGDGAIRFARVVGSVLRAPGQLPALARLAGDAAIARKALRGAAARIGAR
jgi:adenosylhomocysteine nucleosidase